MCFVSFEEIVFKRGLKERGREKREERREKREEGREEEGREEKRREEKRREEKRREEKRREEREVLIPFFQRLLCGGSFKMYSTVGKGFKRNLYCYEPFRGAFP